MSDQRFSQRLREAIADPDVPLAYNDKFREVTIRVLDGGEAGILIEYCPFSGEPLPSSLRDEWFDRLDELDMEPDDPGLPQELRTGQWWREAGL